MTAPPGLHPQRGSGRGLLAVCFANGVEWYDFAIFGALASVTAVVLLPPGDAASRLVSLFAVSATTFLARPVGALLVGRKADRTGRHGTLVAMVLLMSAATAGIGLLPTWQAAGAVAPALLVGLRLVQGFASGGEISTSIPYLLELAPGRRWGFYGSLHTASVALGIASGIAVAALLSAGLTSAALESWGWRVPFLLAAPLGVAGLYVRSRLQETTPFLDESRALQTETETTTLREVWRVHGTTVRNGFVLVGVLAGTFNMWFVFLPAHLDAEGAHPLSSALGCAVVGLLVAAVSAPLWGILSDRVGRRAPLLVGTGGLCLLVGPMYAAARHGEWLLLLAADVVTGVLLGALVVTPHLGERFPLPVRASGIALTYGLATALVGGTAPLVGSALAQRGWQSVIPAYVALLAAAGVVACMRSTSGVPTEGDARGGVPDQPDEHDHFAAGRRARGGGGRRHRSAP